MVSLSLRRLVAVSRKEILHILRDPITLFLSLFIPVVQLLILGFAINTNVRDIGTVVLDQAKTQESRQLLDRFVNTSTFRIIGQVDSDDEMHRALVSGRARVGIKIPRHYSHRVTSGDTAQVLLVVDGSDSVVAGEAVNVGALVALRAGIDLTLQDRATPVELAPRVLFNPDTRSPNFFLPGLLVILTQIMAIMLSANSIVREKEQGTLEQLFMTPVRPRELIPGKLLPYLALTMLEFLGIAAVMRFLFGVPIHGQLATLIAIVLPFLLAMVSVGLWISTRVATRDASLQASIGTVVPTIFLSGYIFPVFSMPTLFQGIAYLIPATWMIDASRGVILRGAGWAELWPHAVVLWLMALILLTISILLFRKRVI